MPASVQPSDATVILGSARSLSQSHGLLEHVIAGKRGLGADYLFEANTLEVGDNHFGVRGIFARRALSKGTVVFSVPIRNGSLTPFRAYEKSNRILSKLGADRFIVPDSFAIACGLYERLTGSDGKTGDLFFTPADTVANYAGSPMTSFGSLARAELLSNNNQLELDGARTIDDYIARLNVDPVLFRSLLAYVASRYWKGFGVIPVMDWFNSSYSEDINLFFSATDGRFSYTTSTNVEAGEELTWSYNDATAVETWFNYGYVDHERPTLAHLEVFLDEEQKDALETFAEQRLSYPRSRFNPPSKVSKHQFQNKLSCPGRLRTVAERQRSTINAVNSFVNARTWFRLLVLSGMKDFDGAVSRAGLQGDAPVLSLEIECEVMRAMRQALVIGLAETEVRAACFNRTAVGENIDLSPYLGMVQQANGVWDVILALIEDFCAAPTLDESAALLQRRFDLDTGAPSDVETRLSQREAETPTPIGSLALRYLKARLDSARRSAESIASWT